MATGPREIEQRFGFHNATIEGENATRPKHHKLRVDFKAFALMLDDLLPDSREKSIALEDLERASMWAHKAIAKTAPLAEE